MITKLLFTNKSYKLKALFIFCLCFNYGSSQTNLALNSTMDEFSVTTNDNSDAWDMTPSTNVVYDDGSSVASPYKALWNNSALDSWLDTNCGDDSEAPGSSSDGNYDYSAGPTAGVPTRGVKINEACRRLYQYVPVTAGTSYTLFLDSRSEASAVPTEVYILNTEIADEVGLTSTSTTVDAHLDITNDFNSSKSNATTNNFTRNSLEFTPSGSFIVIYITSPLAVDSSTEVFFDNIELYETSTLSNKDFSASNFQIFPNPATHAISIKSAAQNEISNVQVFDLLGKQVMDTELNNNSLNISALSAGMYMVKINAVNGNSITKKIIKE